MTPTYPICPYCFGIGKIITDASPNNPQKEAAKLEEYQPRKTYMTPKQYAAAIQALGLSQRAAGKFLGADERTSRRWIAGDSAIPESVAKLLRLMIKLGLKPDDIID